MTIFVVDRWDKNDLMDASIVNVFLKRENAEKYVREEMKKLEQARVEINEDGEFDDVPYYTYQITPKTPVELW